ncbi:MAG: hypothetical protein HYZ44_16025 [Bacteroidetes bacterium]|nr:hypothetical protein [Bacteroidota bacterium]
MTLPRILQRDFVHYEGVPPINIYLLRGLFGLMFLFLSYDSWNHIIRHTGYWEPVDAAAWCMWAGYASISFIGVIRPLKMLPIIVFEVIYKITWLLAVAYPLWSSDSLDGSSVEYTANVFIWVLLPAAFMPWKYFVMSYVLGKKLVNNSAKI